LVKVENFLEYRWKEVEEQNERFFGHGFVIGMNHMVGTTTCALRWDIDYVYTKEIGIWHLLMGKA
jgi:hypothetical protein